MSRIDDLILDVAPAGVPFRQVGEIAEIASARVDASTLDRTTYVGVDNLLQNFRGRGDSGYSGNGGGAIGFQPGDILIGNIRPYLKKVWLADRVGGASPDVVTVTPRPAWRDRVIPRFMYYLLASDAFIDFMMKHAKGGKMPRGDKSALLKYRIPVPPLEVQREIVRILDTFSELEAGLEAELEARKVQYAHYRTIVLDRAAERAELLELGSLGRVVTGHTPKASFTAAWGSEVDFVTPSDIKDGMRTVTAPSRHLSSVGAVSMSSSIVPAGSILVTCIGADMGKTIINSNKCVPNQQINAIVLNEGIHNGYLFHVLTSLRGALRTQGERGGGTMPLINKSDFSRITVPIPPIEIQRLAAAQLDKFDGLVNDLSSGLPAEISARRKQYEYYRDHLLTFKEQPGE